jgi:phosphoribosylformimino-5-aminoimidazole carboxamide ribotide isomerase
VTIPTTYAGGAKGVRSLGTLAVWTDRLLTDTSDLDLVDRLSGGKVDLTYGRYVKSSVKASGRFIPPSSLDIFGGTLVKFEELVRRSKEI